MEVGGQHHAPAASREIDTVAIVQEPWWDPGPIWLGAEYLASNQDLIVEHVAGRKERKTIS
jgi:hypothetical protein